MLVDQGGNEWLSQGLLPCGNNGTARFKNVNNCLNTNIYSYLKTSGGQSYNQLAEVPGVARDQM